MHFSEQKKKGFLLAELLVALFIFSLVATISVGSIINIIDANKKNQSLKSVMNNLNLALDSITRYASVGYDYNCSDINGFLKQDCSTPGSSFSFKSPYDLDGDGNGGDVVNYTLTSDFDGGYINRTINPGLGSDPVRITAPEVNIEGLKFLVLGSGGGDTQQPKVFIFVSGSTFAGPRLMSTNFKIQTVISQRLPDINDL